MHPFLPSTFLIPVFFGLNNNTTTNNFNKYFLVKKNVEILKNTFTKPFPNQSSIYCDFLSHILTGSQGWAHSQLTGLTTASSSFMSGKLNPSTLVISDAALCSSSTPWHTITCRDLKGLLSE